MREISEIRYIARHELCLLHGARAAHNKPFGMVTKHPERRQGQGCGRSPHPKGLALMLPEWRVALARCAVCCRCRFNSQPIETEVISGTDSGEAGDWTATVTLRPAIAIERLNNVRPSHVMWFENH